MDVLKLKQCFSNLGEHQNLGDPVHTNSWAPPPEILTQQVWEGSENLHLSGAAVLVRDCTLRIAVLKYTFQDGKILVLYIIK